MMRYLLIDITTDLLDFGIITNKFDGKEGYFTMKSVNTRFERYGKGTVSLHSFFIIVDSDKSDKDVVERISYLVKGVSTSKLYDVYIRDSVDHSAKSFKVHKGGLTCTC